MQARIIVVVVLAGVVLSACGLASAQPLGAEGNIGATVAAQETVIAAQVAELGSRRSSSGGPEEVAAAAFEGWAQQTGVPYKEARQEMLHNDGVFATVRIAVKFRASSNSPWREHTADVQCRNVGGKWRADTRTIYLELTEAEQEKQKKQVMATSTAAARAWFATATVEAVKAATVQAEQVIATANAQAIATAAFEATATARSQAIARPQPPATAAPCTAAITGLCMVAKVSARLTKPPD